MTSIDGLGSAKVLRLRDRWSPPYSVYEKQATFQSLQLSHWLKAQFEPTGSIAVSCSEASCQLAAQYGNRNKLWGFVVELQS
jgi:hypothetical protein